MTTELTLAVNTPFEALVNRKIESNIETLLPLVKERTAEYKATQYTIGQEKLCREHRAQINKFLKAVDNEIKEVGKANNKPFEEFVNEVDPLISELVETIKFLDKQIAEMENRWREQNLKNAECIYNYLIGGTPIAEWISFEQILLSKKTARVTYEAEFGNKGSWSYPEGMEETEDIAVIMKAGKKVADTMQQFIDMAQRNFDNIVAFEYPVEMTEKALDYLGGSYNPLKKAFDLDGAIALLKDLKRRDDEKAEAVEKAKREERERAQKEAEELKRKAEEEKQKAVREAERRVREEAERERFQEKANIEAEQSKHVQEENVPSSVTSNNSECKWFTMHVLLDKERAKKLTAYMRSEGITFEVEK